MKKIEKNIVEYFQKIGWAAYVAGLQDTHSGNMSMRIGSRMLITRRGSMLGFLNGHDIIELSLEKMTAESAWLPVRWGFTGLFIKKQMAWLLSMHTLSMR